MSLKFSHPISASFLSVLSEKCGLFLSVLSKKKPRRDTSRLFIVVFKDFYYPSWALCMSPVSRNAVWNAKARESVWGVWPPRPILR